MHEAVDHFERTVVILERTEGVDHYDVAHAYANLAIAVQGVEPSKTALNYMRRALYLSELRGGASSPELIPMYTNLASILQDLAHFSLATSYVRKALALSESIFGPSHPETGACLHTLALNLTVLGEFREALAAETRHYEICKTIYGETHQQTVESNLMLKTITTSAVTVAKAQLGAKKQQRLPTARAKTLAEQSAASKAGSVSFAEILKRAETLGVSTTTNVNATGKASRNRVTIAQGSSWRSKAAPTVGSSAVPAAAAPMPAQKIMQQQQQHQRQQQQQLGTRGSGKKSKKAGNNK